MKQFLTTFLTLGICTLALTSCNSERPIGATAAPYKDASCPAPSGEGRGNLTLASGEVLKTNNLCLIPETATYEGRPAKLIWGETSPVGPVIAELSNTGSALELAATGGRTGTQITLQQGNTRLAINFSVNALDTKTDVKTGGIDTSTNFKGTVTVPPLRGLNYLDSRGRGADVGYDETTGFYAADGEYAEEATKETQEREVEDGPFEIQITKVNPEKNEISGTFISRQPTGLAVLKGKLEIKGRFIANFKKV